MKVLSIDIGGTNVKVLATGQEQRRKFASGEALTPEAMVEQVKQLTADWAYEAISIGYPGVVVRERVVAEPANLGRGWVGFDFARAFGRPVKLINDAAMQALGNDRGGSLLFLGLGTGLGSALVVEGRVQPLELAHLPYRKHRSYEQYLGKAGLERMGKKKWRRHVWKVVALFREALQPGEVVIGGGNAALLEEPPEGVRLGTNASAFEGGFRLWKGEGER